MEKGVDGLEGVDIIWAAGRYLRSMSFVLLICCFAERRSGKHPGR